MKFRLMAGLFLLVLATWQAVAQKMVIEAPKVDPRPLIKYRHAYDQSMFMKIYLSEPSIQKGIGEMAHMKVRDTGESKVYLNFEQVLDLIKRVDQLTLGLHKIIYLVGWQYNGHDSKYPAWHEVNPKLRRPQDGSALESMKWLMQEAFKYNTTLSVHINMFDAYEDSPLWETYLENDIIARKEDGSIRPGGYGYSISYAQEWKTGFAQKRIDAICDMLPLAKAGTVHIDAFHSWIPDTEPGPISPFLGFTLDQETEAQRNIYYYWDSKGIDVTSEGVTWLRKDAFAGLQPAAWMFNSGSIKTHMSWPASYYCGGLVNGDFGRLIGSNMHGEDIFRQDPVNLPGFMHQFCTLTVPWYYLNRFPRERYVADEGYSELHYGGGVVSRMENGVNTIRRNGRLLLEGNDMCMPVLWKDTPSLIAYSLDGYRSKTWELDPSWTAKHVKLYRITKDGLENISSEIIVKDHRLTLSLQKDEAVYIVPTD